jgi:hypothetical protein
MDYSKLPASVEPVYSTDYPSQKIHLYEGEIKYSYKINEIPGELLGTGTIKYSWFPDPQVIFEINHYHPIPYNLDDASIKLQGSDQLVPVNTQSWGSYSQKKAPHHIAGVMSKEIIVGKGDNLHSIIFHVVNFCSYMGEVTYKRTQFEESTNKGRINLSEKDWDIVIDEISSEKNTDVFKSLKESGGYAITHVGRIKKKDNSSFNAEEVMELIEALSYFLSFAKGAKVPIVLFVGYNANDEKMYEQWNESFGQPSKYRMSWMPKRDLGDFSKIFSSFIKWWKMNNNVARIAINSYLEANQNSFDEIGLILSQSILELLARSTFEEETRLKYSNLDDFEMEMKKYDDRNNNPLKRIETFLNGFSIPIKFPTEAEALKKYSSDSLASQLRQPAILHTNHLKSFCLDIPKMKDKDRAMDALIKVRNEMTHANKEHGFSAEVIGEARNLSLWYVEMSILSILQYNGLYDNRLIGNKHAGQYDTVPWAEEVS